jgi:hypothetical protein
MITINIVFNLDLSGFSVISFSVVSSLMSFSVISPLLEITSIEITALIKKLFKK